MERINVLEILESELSFEEEHKNHISNMRNKDYATNYMMDMIYVFLDDYVSPKLNELKNKGIISYVDETDDLCYELLEELHYSNDKRKEYLDFIRTKDNKIKNDIADKVCDFLVKRENVGNAINNFINDYLKDKLNAIDIKYDLKTEDVNNKKLSQFVYYVVLYYFDKDKLYISDFCYTDDYQNFLFTDDEIIKKEMADMILNIIIKNRKDILKQISYVDEYSYYMFDKEICDVED